jgi:hypothetical protein
MTHQFNLFSAKEMKPTAKPGITKKRLLEGKAMLAKGNNRGAVDVLRDINDKLEIYLSRL